MILRPANPPKKTASTAAFTLMEMAVVIGIILVIAALALPAFKGITKSQGMNAANRQLLDDAGLARQIAISTRSTVFMVFSPPYIGNFITNGATLAAFTNAVDRQMLTNLVTGQYSSYALYAERSVGDQPGQQHPRYITDWRTLPEGIFIATNAYNLGPLSPFLYLNVKFPTDTGPFATLPVIAWNSLGQLVEPNAMGQMVPTGRDAVIPFARGSILYERNPDGTPVIAPADIQEVPPGNSTDPGTYNHIVINWLTGRARVDRAQIQ